MIKHVVCFKLKDGGKKEEAKKVLLSMEGKVPTLRGIEVGTDFLGSPRSYDVFLGVLLEDEKALDEYQNDPYHVGVVKKFMHAETESSVAVDFTFNRKRKNACRKRIFGCNAVTGTESSIARIPFMYDETDDFFAKRGFSFSFSEKFFGKTEKNIPVMSLLIAKNMI